MEHSGIRLAAWPTRIWSILLMTSLTSQHSDLAHSMRCLVTMALVQSLMQIEASNRHCTMQLRASSLTSIDQAAQASRRDEFHCQTFHRHCSADDADHMRLYERQDSAASMEVRPCARQHSLQSRSWANGDLGSFE